MQLDIPLEVLAVLYTLRQAGFDAYIVGGAVRDLLRAPFSQEKVTAVDYDFTTNATPEQIQALFPESFYENTFGTVSITPENLRLQLNLPTPLPPAAELTSPSTRLIDLAHATKLHQSLLGTIPYSSDTHQVLDEPYEITTYRSDGAYTDHRRPESVTWGTTLKGDLSRRDFTINAMALSVEDRVLSELFNAHVAAHPLTITLTEEEVILLDPFKGFRDLSEGRLQTVGVASERFQEDALRMLRAIRLSAQLSCRISDETYQAIQDHAKLLSHISAERIHEEFNKMLLTPHAREAIEQLADTGLLATFMPELLAGKNVAQGGHHTTDVWTHSLDALATCPSHDPVVRLATLLHDISKPETCKVINGQPTFYNHEVVGARVAKRIAERLKYSKKDCERVFILVRNHMFHYQPENTDSAIRRFMKKVGLQNIDDILDLREADRLGSGARKTSWRLEEMKERMVAQLNQPLDVTDLAIDGTDLMTELKLTPGPVIGTLLHTLFEKVMEEPQLNTKETLLAAAREELAKTTTQ